MQDLGHKEDKGKLEMSLVPYDAFKQFVLVLMWGAYERPRSDGSRGYGANNWELVYGARKRYYDALLRHVNVWYHEKERIDPESGYHHLAHAMCCLVFLLALSLRGNFALEEGETMEPVAISLPTEMIPTYDPPEPMRFGFPQEAVPGPMRFGFPQEAVPVSLPSEMVSPSPLPPPPESEIGDALEVQDEVPF